MVRSAEFPLVLASLTILLISLVSVVGIRLCSSILSEVKALIYILYLLSFGLKHQDIILAKLLEIASVFSVACLEIKGRKLNSLSVKEL